MLKNISSFFYRYEDKLAERDLEIDLQQSAMF